MSRGKWMQINTVRYHYILTRAAKLQEREHQMLARMQSNRNSLYRWGRAEWRGFTGEQIGLKWFVLSDSNGLRMCAYARTYMQVLRAAQKSPVWLLLSEWLQEQMMRDCPVPIYIFESIKPWEDTQWHGTKQMKPMTKGHVLCGDIYVTSWKDKAKSNLKKKINGHQMEGRARF